MAIECSRRFCLVQFLTHQCMQRASLLKRCCAFNTQVLPTSEVLLAQEEARHAVPDKFDLVVPPKTPLPQEGTLHDFGLHPNSVVLVVEVESDEEDSEGAAAD
ncbi:hypothetical protein ACSSS7_006305 [Eimeria intestinalis]